MELKEKIKLITIPSENTIKNHFLGLLTVNNSFRSELKNDTILLWKRNSKVISNYPIFEIVIKNESIKSIKIKKNPITKLLNILIYIALIANYIAIILLGKQVREKIILTIITSIIIFLISILYKQIKKDNYDLCLSNLNFELNKISISNKVSTTFFKNNNAVKNEKEFGIKMTLRRLLIYPFCLFIIFFLLYNLIDGNFNTNAIFGISIAITYLIIDLKIILGKKK